MLADMATDSVYRIQSVAPADTGYGALTINVIPASTAAAESAPEVGDYFVVHKDNGPPEECE
jgi:hypothetical protein